MSRIPAPLQPLIERVGGPRRAAVLGVGIATALLILGLAKWATAPTWVPAFSGLPLETVGEVTRRLDEAGIAYRLENGGGEIRVASDDLPRARVLLAGEGLPNAGRPGLELFDQPSWGMTDFTQRINYRRAMEGELERTIGKMRGIDAAQVHLSIQEQSSFRRADRPAEASVVLKLKDGSSPSQDVVEGIAHLVASSVDGLDSERVTVLDDGGHMLSSAREAGSLAGLSSQQLEVQREIESDLENRTERIISQIVGPGNTRVQVSALVNYDRVERTVEAVDPDRQALASEQTSELVPGPQGGAGSTSAATTYENSRTLETFAGATGTVKRLSVAVLVNDRVVPPAEEGGTPTVEPRSAAEIARIETLVQSAIGFDASRGDVVSVVSVPFDGIAAPMAEPSTPLPVLVGEFWRPAVLVLALLLAFGIALRTLGTLKAASLPAAESALALEPGRADGAELGAAPAAEPALAPVEPLVLPASDPARNQVVQLMDQQPDVAVRLLRAWLKEA